MPDGSWSGPPRRNLPRVHIRPRASCWKPANGCMRREWRPSYDPLPRPPRWTWTPDVVWRLHPAVSSVSDRARRFPERDEGELADIAGNHSQASRPVWPGPATARALLAVAEVFRPRRIRILFRIQHPGIHAALAARAQYLTAERSGAVDFMVDRSAVGGSGCRMERTLGGPAFFRRNFSPARFARCTHSAARAFDSAQDGNISRGRNDVSQCAGSRHLGMAARFGLAHGFASGSAGGWFIGDHFASCTRQRERSD